MQVRSAPRSTSCPQPRPAARDLGRTRRGRGRAPARRRHRPWRHPLVRPARGLPHRDPRADEGADGEERGDRAGRRQGRVRREAAATSQAGATRRSSAGCSTSPTTGVDGQAVVPPPGVVRRDGDDPYLVVAADKGTGAFSDVANELAAEYGYWLGDAFASGGSAGFDHKEMGITSRGAWVSVQAHFRAARRRRRHRASSPSSASATCRATCSATGCCARRTCKLVAAFDHRHVFVDPDPDPAARFAERRRLFDAPAVLVGRLRPRGALRRWRRVPAHGEVGRPLRRRRARVLGVGDAAADARRAWCARSCARPSTSSGTAGSARS